MTKKRNNSNKKKKVVVRARTMGVRRGVAGMGLDAQALAYAKLLYDPCGAPMVHPVYAGGDCGFLFRAENVITYTGAATDTAGFVHWTPGYVNSNNTEVLVQFGASDNASLIATSNLQAPGRAFLAANAAGMRCVAACMKITYPGTEQGRQGRIHYGHTQASTIDAGDTVTVAGLVPLLQHYGRTPAETVEVMWRPGFADQEFVDPGAGSQPQLRDRRTSITMAWAGLPAGVGITIHYTAVYEWQPRLTLGVATNTTGKNASRNTLDQVIDALQTAGFRWVRAAGMAAGMGLSQALTTSISRTFGLMPAQQRGRQFITFRDEL